MQRFKRIVSALLHGFLVWVVLTILLGIFSGFLWGNSETPSWFSIVIFLLPLASAISSGIKRAKSAPRRRHNPARQQSLSSPPQSVDKHPVLRTAPTLHPATSADADIHSVPIPHSHTPRTELSKGVTVQDMLHFVDSPYVFDQQLYSYVSENTHPEVFMDLSPHNIEIAKQHFSMLNSLIFEQFSNIPRLNPLFLVSPDSLAFYPYHDSYGYTRIVCTPYTPSGGISRSPFYLCYMTRLDNFSSSVNGMIFYGVDGRIRKATLNSWRWVSDDLPSDGWAFEFKDRGGQLALWEVTTTLGAPNGYPMRSVYKHKDLLEEERVRDADRQSFLWLQRNLPDECPKTFPGFRRMKAANSKNYQVLQLKAEKLGRKI